MIRGAGDLATDDEPGGAPSEGCPFVAITLLLR